MDASHITKQFEEGPDGMEKKWSHDRIFHRSEEVDDIVDADWYIVFRTSSGLLETDANEMQCSLEASRATILALSDVLESFYAEPGDVTPCGVDLCSASVLALRMDAARAANCKLHSDVIELYVKRKRAEVLE